MHIISRKPLHDFSAKHPQAKTALDTWHAEVKHAQWRSPVEVRASYRSADVLADNRVVFNICGNKYRLVVRVAYHSQTVFIRFVGTHADYDKINATNI